MVEKKPANVASDFESFLSSCPEAGEDAGQKLRVHGALMRSKKTGSFALQTADNVTHEIPTSAVESFAATGAGGGAKTAVLTLNRAALDAGLAEQLS